MSPLIMLGLDARDLATVWNIFKMNLRDRYLGSRFGAVWAVLNPLLMLMIFVYVFGFLFKVRLPGAETTFAYAIWLIIGYGPWLAISESLNSSANSVVAASGLIKNLAFKSETLPIASALLGCVPLAVTMIFVLVLMAVDANVPSWHVAAIPLIMVLQFLLVVAFGFFLAATNVFVRDLGLVLPNILTMILFLSPIFYPVESMPAALRGISAYNPFFLVADAYRAVLLRHELPPAIDLLYLAAFAAVVGYFSLRYFRRAKESFDAAL